MMKTFYFTNCATHAWHIIPKTNFLTNSSDLSTLSFERYIGQRFTEKKIHFRGHLFLTPKERHSMKCQEAEQIQFYPTMLLR